MERRQSINRNIIESAEQLKGLLATIKGHFEPSMVLKNSHHTYEMIKESLNLCWDICDLSRNDLSDREKEVAQLITEGLSNYEIAEKLFVTENTVKFHITSIYGKLGIRSRAQLIVEFYKNELEKTRRDNAVLQEKLNTLPAGNDRRCDELPRSSLS